MKTDQNSNMQGTLDKRISMKKRRNAKRALLALNLVAVIFTTTVFSNPVSVLSEEVSTDAVQSIEDNAGGDAQIAEQADVQQNTAEAAQAAEAPAAENSAEAAKAEEPSGVNAPAENAMSAEMNAAEDGVVSTDDGASSASAVQSADASSASNGAFEDAGAGNTDGTKDGIIENDAEGLNEAEGTAANEEAEDAASQEQLTYEDEHVKISASYTDGRAFTADSILTGTYLDSDEKNAVLSAVNTQISKGNSADTVSDTAENTESSGSTPVASTTATTVEYSVAGFHALMLAAKNQDGSDTTTEGDVTFSAEFKKGLNDAGYASREETTENNEAGGDGSLTTTTTRCETSWKIYTVTEKNLTDITDITDAHNTHYEMDENGTLKSASFRGALPQTVAFVQIVKKTVTETTTQKETEKATERETESEKDTETQKAKETEKITGTETEQATEKVTEKVTEKTTERETDDVKEQVSSSAAMPAVTFDQKVTTDNGTVMVHVEAEEGAFEEGTSMTVTPVTSQTILDKAIDAAGGKGAAAAMDITFTKPDGTKTEPLKPIHVKMISAVLNRADEAHVVHVADSGSTDVVAKKSDGKTVESTSNDATSSDAKNAVSFESDSFSVYAIVYTVDFTFSGYTYSIKGGSSIRLSSLAQKLGLRDTKQGKDFDIADVEDVTFSDSSLVTVTKKDGDWELESREPFTSTEKLTISMKDGSKYEVEVKDEQENKLGKYITSVTTYTKDGNGRWNPNNNIKDGDNVKFELNYKVESEQLNKGEVLTYKMDPQYIGVSELTTGDAIQKGQKIGTMSVSPDGTITLRLNEDYDVSQAFEGSLNFIGTAHNTNSDNPVTVDFGANAHVTIQPKTTTDQYDISTQKTGRYYSQNGKHYIHYEVTISTTKGTGDAIQFSDSMNAFGIDVPNYNTSKVWVYQNNNQSVVSGLNPRVNNGKLEIDNLPELQAGEKYHVIYEVPVEGNINSSDGSAKVSNNCCAWNNHVTGWGNTTTTIHEPIVKKEGYQDYQTGKLKWTITVNNPDRQDLSGTTLKDVFTVTDGDSSNITFPLDFTIKDGSGNKVGTGKFDANGNYTFPSGSSAEQYKIEYETPAPTGNEGTSSRVKNKVTYNNHGKEYTGESGEITVSHPTYNVTKSYSMTDGQTETGEKIKWTARIDLPESDLDLSKLTYTDTMTAWDGSTSLSERHYTTPALLKELVLWTENSTRLTYGTDYKLFDLTGNDISDMDVDTKLAGFQIQFLDVALSTLKGNKNISLNYDTIADEDGQPDGSTWTFKNKAAIQNHESEVKYDHIKPNGNLTKQVSTSGTDTSYSSNDPEIEYSENGMTLYYRVLIRLNKDSKGEQTIVDTIPSGMKFGKLTKVVYYENDNDQRYDLNSYNGNWNFKLSDHVITTTSENKTDGTTKVTFILSDGYEIPYKDYQIAFYYTATIEDRQFWNDIRNEMKPYSNTVQWGNLTSDVTTNVKHTIKKLDKIGQLSDVEDVKGVKKAIYYLPVNPKGEDLVKGSDTLTLQDQLTSGEKDVQMDFQPASLKVYAYDAAGENHCGALIDPNRYGFSYEEKTHTLTLTLPDEVPCVVYYEYCVTPGINATQLSNSARLSGVAESSIENKLALDESSAGAKVSRKDLDLYKVDSENYNIKLQGVTFRLEEYKGYKNNAAVWSTVKEASTNEKGQIHLNKIDDKLEEGVLYKLTETNLGTNNAYSLNNKPYYFVWAKFESESKSDWEIWSEVPQYDHSGVTQDEVYIIRTSGTIYVPNEKTGIRIDKVWLNADHTDDANPGTAHVTLYRQARKPGGVKVTVKVWTNRDWPTELYHNEVYIKSDTKVSLLVRSQYGEEYIVNNGPPKSFNNHEDHAISLGSPTEDTLYSVFVTYPPDKIYKDLLYTPTEQYTNVGERKIIDSYDLDSSNKNSVTVGPLDLNDKDGNNYYYWVEEEKVAGYTTSYSGNNGKIQKGTITVTNTREESSVSVKKAWVNSDGTNTPPVGAFCTFELLQNGNPTGKKITLDGTEDEYEFPAWQANFIKLNKFDQSGKEISYSVKEVSSLTGYIPDKREVGNGGTITNSQEQKLEFTKIWSEGAIEQKWPSGKSIKVTLYRELLGSDKKVLEQATPYAIYMLAASEVTKHENSEPDCELTMKNGRYSYLISGLPSVGTIAKGDTTYTGNWHYFVKEEKANGYLEPKYGDLSTGSVVVDQKLDYAEDGQAIINEKESSYELPSTGGSGDLPWVASGILLILLAGAVFMVRKFLIYRSRGKGGGLRS
ncbi:Cna B-type domain-containing protein [Porcincola intestinalis]|uniref:Cna B-type domain-containing protein n=1 Tax=Porcincola intestinalis TaxID=2606632 RepID=UPI002A918392|nr:Cna B-type domain-containing protein [Porcincola intestinalis]MDY5578723.1 Cna B-type domain-containing protein [Porcincola intestinalis]